MAQARERGIEPKIDPELEALIKVYDELNSVRPMRRGVAASHALI